jgi:predicted TIM-barrel fold metal-dependent hydrolase
MNPPTPLPHSVTRRTFLRSSILAALAPAAYAASPATRHAHHGAIDAHVHVWTADTQRYPIAHGFSVKKDMKPASFTPEELFAHCHPSGVRRIVLIQMSFYQFDNRYMLDCMARHPGVFRGVGIVDETKPNVRGTMKALESHGVRGFRLYSNRRKAEAWSRSPGMKEMWACGADRGLAMCLLADPKALPAVERMCQAYPRTPVVIDHCGRIGRKGRIRQEDVDQLCRLAHYPHTHVKISAFYALGAKKAPYTDLGPMIHQLRDAYGASRLMWGSDCPFQVQDGQTYADSIALIRDRLDFLTPHDKHWMLHGTAEKVFFS